MKKFIFNHTSPETAFEVKDYPYGFRLRTSIFYWIETIAKKGDRFCSYTINPKNGRANAPKKSTFSNLGAMFLDENNHVHWLGVTIYSNREEVKTFVDSVGEQNLKPEQKKQFRQLIGEKLSSVNEFGNPKKDFKVKFEKDGEVYSEVRITFDRPDGVSAREIFEALKSLDQDKLNKVFEGWESQTFGHVDGFVRVCVRGGFQLCTVERESYKEFLASDHSQ